MFLTFIGPNWLEAKDEAGQRRLHHPDDFIAIEIAAALARNIRVIPVLVDGARMPELSELPDSLKPLARLQALEVHQLHFDRDAEALVERVRAALSDKAVGLARWRVRTLAGAAVVVVLLLIGAGGYAVVRHILDQGEQAELKWEEERRAGEAAAKRKVDEAETQRLASLKAEQERQARAAAEAEAKRKSEEAEQQRVAALKEEERNRAEAETRARYSALISQGSTDSNAGDNDRAIADFNQAIQLDPKNALAFRSRGDAYTTKGDNDRAIADYNEAIRLDPKSALVFIDRGDAYTTKGDNDRAIADYNEAIRLDPKNALALSDRGVAYANKGDNDRAMADFNEAIRLDPKSAHAFRNRGVLYAKKADNDRAIADFNEAIQLDPKGTLALRNRAKAYTNKGDNDRAIADYSEAIRTRSQKRSRPYRPRRRLYDQRRQRPSHR